MSQLPKTLRSLGHKNIAPLLLMTFVLALAIAAALVALITLVSAMTIETGLDWLNTLINVLIFGAAGIIAYFMYPIFTVVVAGILVEQIIVRVERNEYPASKRKATPKIWPDLVHDLRFMVHAIVLNLLISPLFSIGIGFLISFGLNSYLLGREFFETSAGYHLGKPKARKLGAKHWRRRWLNGAAITLFSLIPVINLFIPIIGTVWMLHLYHDLEA